MPDRFQRTEMLLGPEAMHRLKESRVAVFGVGGVGGYVVEALARSGIGALDLIDKDVVDETNINRQIIALGSTIGRPKVEVAAERVKDINPDCAVTTYQIFFLPDTMDQFDFTQYDYVVDAIDTVTAKLLLIQCAKEAGVPVISAMGAGNKLDPTKFVVCDLFETQFDGLARVMRKECRKRGIESLKVVYSEEVSMTPLSLPSEETDGTSPNETPKRRKDTPGSIAFVPSVAGLVLAGEVHVVADLRQCRKQLFHIGHAVSDDIFCSFLYAVCHVFIDERIVVNIVHIAFYESEKFGLRRTVSIEWVGIVDSFER